MKRFLSQEIMSSIFVKRMLDKIYQLSLFCIYFYGVMIYDGEFLFVTIRVGGKSNGMIEMNGLVLMEPKLVPIFAVLKETKNTEFISCHFRN